MSEPNLRRVDLNLLVLFEALMAERHVGRAAARLHMSQSGASYALARLRGLVDDPLFLPHPKGVHPTPRALEMSPAVERMLALARETLGRDAPFDPRHARRSFTLGATDYASFVLLPPLVDRLRREAPGVDLRVRPVDRDSLLPNLDRGALDLAVGLLPGPPDRIRATPLFDERLVCAARRGHPLLQAALTPEMFAAAPQLLVSPRGDPVGPADEALAALGLKRRIVVTAPHFLVAPFVLQASDLVALLAERVARRLAETAALDIRPLPLPVPPWTLSLLQREDRAAEPALAWLASTLVGVGAALR